MRTTRQNIRAALFALIDGIPVTDIIPAGWAEKRPHLPKEIRRYPSFSVTPIRDQESTLDSRSDDLSLTYAVQIVDTWADASDAEDRLDRLIDRITGEVRKQKSDYTPLGGTAYTLGAIAGDWGADVSRGERWYQLNIEVKVTEDTV